MSARYTEDAPFEFEGVTCSPWTTESGCRKVTVKSDRTVYPMNRHTALAIHAFIEAERATTPRRVGLDQRRV